MRRRGNRYIVLSVLMLLLFGGRLLAAEPVARVAVLIGSADVQRSHSGTTEPLRDRADIFLDDAIHTDVGGRVKLLLKDDSIIKVGPKSTVVINRLIVGKKDSETAINLIKGRLRSVIGKSLGETSRYEISTDVAVAGVRGTDFEVVRLEPVAGSASPSTAIRTFEGRVRVTNIDPEVSGSVMVLPNTFTLVLRGRLPAEPMSISPGEDVAVRVRRTASDKRSMPPQAGSGEGWRNVLPLPADRFTPTPLADRRGVSDTPYVGGGAWGRVNSAAAAPFTRPGAPQFDGFNAMELEYAEVAQLPVLPLEEIRFPALVVNLENAAPQSFHNMTLLQVINELVAEEVSEGAANGQLETITTPLNDANALPLQIEIPTPQ